MPTETVKKALPWREGVPAWIMAVEGAIIALLGTYIINQPTNATRVLLIALGALMLFNGIPKLSRYYHGPAESRAEGDMLQGWFGTVVGGVAIVLTLIVQEDNLSGVAILFGIALVIAGVLEVFERFTANKGNRRLGLFILPLILIIAGTAMITARFAQNVSTETMGQFLALLGFALVALGLVRVWSNRQKRQAAKEAEEKRALLAKEIAEADAKAGKTATPPPVTPAPAPVSPSPAPVAPAPEPAGPVAPAAPAPAALPDEPEDPAVAAAQKPDV